MALYRYVVCAPTGAPIGEAAAATSRELHLRLNGPTSDATLVVRLTDTLSGALAPGLARLKVYRDGALVFYGALPPEAVSDDAAADTTNAVFHDPRWILPEHFSLGTESYTATDQGAILWDLVNQQNNRFGGAGETWLRQGQTTTGILRTRAYDRRLVSDLINEMAGLLDGPDVDVNPVDGYLTGSRVMGNLQVYARQGQLRPNAVFVYVAGDSGTNCLNITRRYERVTTYATTLASSTAQVGLAAAYGDPTTSLHGLHEAYSTAPDGATQAQIDADVRGIVEAFKVPRSIIEIAVGTEGPRPFTDYALGDTVYVSARKGALLLVNQPLRVHGIDIKISQEGEETVSLVTSEL